MSFDLVTILGPTASGKTNIAAQLANDFNGEIISADSRQVYRGMNIGTGKDLFEFQKYKINFHLIDIADPSDEYNLFRFKKDFYSALQKIQKLKKLPVLVGGTGLYISSILQSYNLPEIDVSQSEELSSLTIHQLQKILMKLKSTLHNKTDLTDKERIIQSILIEQSRLKFAPTINKLHSLTIGIKPDRDIIKQRITERLKQRLNNGMVEEVKSLMNDGVTKEKMNFFGLEYKFVSQFIDGKLNYNDMFQKLNSAIYNFAKRQMTWFRKMEREGVEINWFLPDSYPEIKNFVNKKFSDEEKLSG